MIKINSKQAATTVLTFFNGLVKWLTDPFKNLVRPFFNQVVVLNIYREVLFQIVNEEKLFKIWLLEIWNKIEQEQYRFWFAVI